MASAIIDTSDFGVSNIKEIYTNAIKGSKAVDTDVFADLKLQAYNGNQSKNVTMTLSVQGDTPKLTFTPAGVAATGAVISGIADSTDTTSAVSKSFVNNHISATTTHGVTGNIVGTGGTQTLTNKTLESATITHNTNNVIANSLRFSTGIVTVNTQPSPAAKDVLMANSATEAQWGKVPYLPIEIMTTNATTMADITAVTDADPFTRVRHYILAPAGVLTYTLANTTNNMLVNMEIYMTLISTGSLLVQGDTNVHLYAPGYNGTAGGSYTLNVRGGTIALKKRNNTEWILMVL